MQRRESAAMGCGVCEAFAGTKPIGRNAHTMTVVDTRLFLFGGHSGSKHLNDLFIFDTQSLTWLRVRRPCCQPLAD